MTSRIDFIVLLLFELLENMITCPSGKLKTEFTNPLAPAIEVHHLILCSLTYGVFPTKPTLQRLTVLFLKGLWLKSPTPVIIKK